MSVGRPLGSLTLYDVLTDLIPGIVFVASIGFILRIEEIEVIGLGTIVVVVVVGGYVTGHVLQSIRSAIWPRPFLFQEVVQKLATDAEETELGKVSAVERDFLRRCRERFELDDDFDDWTQLFRLVVSYLETSREQRAIRFQALHSFHWSMAAAFAGMTVLGIGALVLNWGSINGYLRPPEMIVGTIVGAGLLAVLFESRRRHFERQFVHYLIIDFYVATTRLREPQETDTD